MKKTLSILALLSLAALTTSCADKTAVSYAKQLVAMLDSLIAQTDKKLADEQKRYLAEALDSDRDKDASITTTLSATRRSASTRTLLNQLIEGKTTGAQVINTVLPDYAELDFNATQRIYEKRADAYLDSLRSLQSLNSERAKMKGLRDAVAALTKTPDLLSSAAEYGQFALQLRANLDFHSCVDAQANSTSLAAQVKALSDKIAALPPPTNIATLKSDLALKQAALSAAQAQRDATGRFLAPTGSTEKQCTRP